MTPRRIALAFLLLLLAIFAAATLWMLRLWENALEDPREPESPPAPSRTR